MRGRAWLAGWILLGAASADAGTLTAATWVQTLSPVPWLAPIQLTRSTTELGASGSSTATSISVSLAFPALSTSFLASTTGMAFVFVSITQGGAQAITATPGMASGTPAIAGQVVVGGTTPLVTVPLHHGSPAQITINRASTQFAIGFFYGWFPNTITVKGLATPTLATTQFVAKGTFDLTAQGGGTVTLVAPAKLHVVGEIPEIAGRIHSFTTLTLHFVPEPGALLLLGVAALAAYWRGHRRAAPASNVGPAGSSPCGAVSAVTKVREMGDSSRGRRV